jgi:TldD protein
MSGHGGSNSTRRQFLQSAAAAAAAAALATVGGLTPAEAAAARATSADAPHAPAMDPRVRELLMLAHDEARRSGAEFADARLARSRTSSISTREQQIVHVSESDTLGLGVRVLVQGTWGFGASRDVTRDGAARAARDAVAIARANRLPEADRVRLAPAPVVPDGRWETPHSIDPFTVSVEEKADLLLRTNAAVLNAPNVRFVNSHLLFIKEEKSYEMWGTFNDGKGQPVQVNAVSHGCPASRFRNVNVINTGRAG